jgi:hypothetical protein
MGSFLRGRLSGLFFKLTVPQAHAYNHQSAGRDSIDDGRDETIAWRDALLEAAGQR